MSITNKMKGDLNQEKRTTDDDEKIWSHIMSIIKGTTDKASQDFFFVDNVFHFHSHL